MTAVLADAPHFAGSAAKLLRSNARAVKVVHLFEIPIPRIALVDAEDVKKLLASLPPFRPLHYYRALQRPAGSLPRAFLAPAGSFHSIITVPLSARSSPLSVPCPRRLPRSRTAGELSAFPTLVTRSPAPSYSSRAFNWAARLRGRFVLGWWK